MADETGFNESCKEISFKAPWGVIAAKEWGPEDGKPFLGLHGWLDNANTFDKLAPLLPEDIHFIAIDFPGHGKSSHRWPGMAYHYFEYVADVKKVVSQLKWQTFSIIGHSMGGLVASIYAGSFPNEVENLVLMDYGLGPPPRFADRPADVLARYATVMSDMKAGTPRVYENVEAAAARREEPFAGSFLVSLGKEDALLLTKRGTTVTKDGVIFSHDPILKGFLNPFIASQWSMKVILSKIQSAVLVLEGTDSVKTNVEDEKARQERLTVICDNAKFKMWKDVRGGHHLHLDNPEETANKIQQFLVTCSSVISKL